MRIPLGLLLFALAPFSLGQESAPNVLLVMADDMGVECVGAYGSDSYRTPRLDRMAAEGVLFENAHSMPLCTPTRVQIMSGRSNAATYDRFSILAPGVPTFAQRFAEAGYRTICAGKWQLYGAAHYPEGHRGQGTLPAQAGFHTWLLWQVEELGSRYWDPLVERDGELLPVQEGAFGPDLSVDFLLESIDARGDAPFFAYYPMALPHNPFVRTPRSAEGELSREQRFADMVAYVDHCMGRLLDGLEQRGLAEQTLVLFTCDNGTNRNIRSSRLGLEVQGGKGLTDDTGTHVPLIGHWPGRLPAGVRRGELVSLEDVFPTLLAACELASAPELELSGLSFWPQLQGRSGPERSWIASYYWPRPTRANTAAVRWARDLSYKLYEDGRLYDLLRDPAEAHPLSVRAGTPQAAAAERLRAGLRSLPDPPLRVFRAQD